MAWLQSCIVPVLTVAAIAVRNRSALEEVSNYYHHLHTQT
jgi:hypothetical protein